MKKQHGNKGKKLTEEHKRKISLAHQGKHTTHGMFGTRFYRIYYKMWERCKPNHPKRKSYFDKGITVEWNNFLEFRDDMLASYLEHCEEHGIKQTTIDRIDNDRGYVKENCRWATYKVQNKNRAYPKTSKPITYNGKSQSLAQWSRDLGFKNDKIRQRLRAGWSVEKAFTTR